MWSCLLLPAKRSLAFLAERTSAGARFLWIYLVKSPVRSAVRTRNAGIAESSWRATPSGHQRSNRMVSSCSSSTPMPRAPRPSRHPHRGCSPGSASRSTSLAATVPRRKALRGRLAVQRDIAKMRRQAGREAFDRASGYMPVGYAFGRVRRQVAVRNQGDAHGRCLLCDAEYRSVPRLMIVDCGYGANR
jgi:hypothetical protein